VNRGLTVSLGLHVAVFVAVMLGPAPKAFEWDVETVPVDLVSAPIEVPADAPPQALPEPEITPPVEESVPEVEATPDPEPEAPAPEPEPVKPPPKKVRPPRKYQRVAPAREDDAPSLAERLQQRLQENETTEASAQATPSPPPPPASAASTAEVQATDFPFAWYLKQVQTRVRDSWDTPGDRLVAGHSNRVAVRFIIHRSGRVSAVTVESGSGTPGLDSSARRAVENAQPFPPLPEPYEGDTLELTIRFTVGGEAD